MVPPLLLLQALAEMSLADAADGMGQRQDRARDLAADAPRPAALAASRSGRGQALAIVGGAAFLGGLLIGDDAGTAIAIGGLAMGIYGLWLWLN